MENREVGKNVSNGEDDLRDEEKMEKFFALIRNFHEARNRRKLELIELEEKNKKNKKRRIDRDHDHHGICSWVPKFEWQDFSEEIEFRKLPVIFPNPCNNRKEKKQQEDDKALDLKLTL